MCSSRDLTDSNCSFLCSAIAVGIAVWRVMANKNDSSGSSSSGDGKLQFISGTAKVVKSNPSDPSQFEKDSRLKPIFYGLAYTPYAVLEPFCGATLANVTEDMQLLSQLTSEFDVSHYLRKWIKSGRYIDCGGPNEGRSGGGERSLSVFMASF